MFTVVPYRRTISLNQPLVNAHFMREFFNVEAPRTQRTMRVDIRELSEAYLLEAELPGIPKEAISISVQDGSLTISADLGISKGEQKDNYVCTERQSGPVQRSFQMEGIEVSAIKANYENGVLMLHLPKQKVEEKAKAFQIAIGDRLEMPTEEA